MKAKNDQDDVSTLVLYLQYWSDDTIDAYIEVQLSTEKTIDLHTKNETCSQSTAIACI